jgi:hypothetical protein
MCVIMDHGHKMWRYGLSVYIHRGELKLVYEAVTLIKHVFFMKVVLFQGELQQYI